MSDAIHFDHVALAAPNRDPVRDFLLDLLGGTMELDQRDPHVEPGFRSVHIVLDGTMVEVIEPTSPRSFLLPFLAKRGPGLHHLTWHVEGLNGFLAGLAGRGVPLTGLEHNPEGKVLNSFIRPSASFGVLTQFRPIEHALRRRERHRLEQSKLSSRPSRGRLASVALAGGETELAFFQSILGGQAGEPIERGPFTVRSLQAGGAVLEFLSERDVPVTPQIAIDGPGIHSISFALTQFDETIASARSMGLRLLPGEDDHTVYLDRANPANALIRLIDIG